MFTYKISFAGITTLISWSLSNNDGDGNESGKKVIGSLSKTTPLHVHHAFLYCSLSSVHGYDVKMPIFTFYGGREHKTTVLLLFWELRYSPLEFNS